MDMNEAVTRLFAPARRPGRVGAEVELIPVTDTARPRPVDPAVLAAGFDAGFVAAAALSFEPGGQLELSPAPRPTARALAGDLDWMLRRATAIAAARGIRLEATGLNPYHSCAAAAPRFPIPAARHPSYHLSTLFPPVRPRGGCLEVRYLDAQPPGRIGEAAETVAALLYDPRARSDALDLLLPRAGDQQRAWSEAATGFSPEADALLSIARAARQANAPGLAGGGAS